MLRRRRLGLSLLLTLIGAGFLLAGSLEPPGAPAPTMVTLQEIVDAIPAGLPNPPVVLTQLPAAITTSGVYVLDSDHTVTAPATAITITAPDVVLDLRGHTVTLASGPLFLTAEAESVSIRNGRFVVQEPGSAPGGISLDAQHIDLSDITVVGSSNPIEIQPPPFSYVSIHRLKVWYQVNRAGLWVSCSQCVLELEDSILTGGDDQVLLSGIRGGRVAGNRIITFGPIAALYVVGDANLIANNLLTPGGTNSEGIRIEGSNNVLRENIIDGFHDSAIYLRSGVGNLLDQNQLSASEIGVLSDPGTQYVLRENTILGMSVAAICGVDYLDAGGNVCDSGPEAPQCAVDTSCT